MVWLDVHASMVVPVDGIGMGGTRFWDGVTDSVVWATGKRDCSDRWSCEAHLMMKQQRLDCERGRGV